RTASRPIPDPGSNPGPTFFSLSYFPTLRPSNADCDASVIPIAEPPRFRELCRPLNRAPLPTRCRVNDLTEIIAPSLCQKLNFLRCSRRSCRTSFQYSSAVSALLVLPAYWLWSAQFASRVLCGPASCFAVSARVLFHDTTAPKSVT